MKNTHIPRDMGSRQDIIFSISSFSSRVRMEVDGTHERVVAEPHVVAPEWHDYFDEPSSCVDKVRPLKLGPERLDGSANDTRDAAVSHRVAQLVQVLAVPREPNAVKAGRAGLRIVGRSVAADALHVDDLLVEEGNDGGNEAPGRIREAVARQRIGHGTAAAEAQIAAIKVTPGMFKRLGWIRPVVSERRRLLVLAEPEFGAEPGRVVAASVLRGATVSWRVACSSNGADEDAVEPVEHVDALHDLRYGVRGGRRHAELAHAVWP
eukprot:scaffold109369_cov63-Phaeocystis_antarctica.AAC.3